MHRPAAQPVVSRDSDAERTYAAAPASALVFDPPPALGVPHPELARGPRAPGAFFGFEQSTSEFYYSETDDLQSNLFGDILVHQSISAKTGVRYR